MIVWLLSVVVLVTVIAYAYYRLTHPFEKHIKGDELSVWPFEVMPLMTDSEIIFFRKLQQALPEYLIFSQVQLSRMIEPSQEAGNERQFWFNRVCRQSVDFVIVAADAKTILLAIELDDWTHQNRTRKKQDDKKDKALTSAGIAIMRFHAEKLPSVEVLRAEILQVIHDCT